MSLHWVSRKYADARNWAKSNNVFIFGAVSFPYGGTSNGGEDELKPDIDWRGRRTLIGVPEHAHFAEGFRELVEDVLAYFRVRRCANSVIRHTHHKVKGVDLGRLVDNQPLDGD